MDVDSRDCEFATGCWCTVTDDLVIDSCAVNTIEYNIDRNRHNAEESITVTVFVILSSEGIDAGEIKSICQICVHCPEGMEIKDVNIICSTSLSCKIVAKLSFLQCEML